MMDEWLGQNITSQHRGILLHMIVFSFSESFEPLESVNQKIKVKWTDI